ncbi:lysoplasmalogenase-like protein TMEM86A isoform X1 [Schistocerca gregaria]|uniref:lysoplasmalogenase-like protein TMEM86A isoform X1 n=1 Tax=Schistocerca gregaria TaxID=7010 RepID=UPI00211E8C6D|nr:lysoplasmalogenase-like protein TMEM86A isoform X1 [Schistocerca gregaria]
MSVARPTSADRASLKSVGPKLVPFFKTVAIYFVLFIPVERPSWAATLVKCLPIVCLIGFVLLHGISLGDEYTFSRRILTGLAFSCLGDALLVWPHYFLHGMAAFGVAQLMYTAAFGFKPLNVQLGAALYALCATAVVILMPGLSGVLMIGVPIYSILLVTMAWRAIARVQFFEELWTWTKLCSCAGGIVFAISDALIGFHHFHHPIPHSQALIMITYYAAQLGIALSVVDSKDSYDKTKTITSSEPANTKIRIAIPQSSSSH